MEEVQRGSPGSVPMHMLPTRLAGVVALFMLSLPEAVGKTPYFFGKRVFLCLFFGFFLWSELFQTRKGRGGSQAAGIFGLTFFSYAIMELVFEKVPLALPIPGSGSSIKAFVENLNGYFLDRSFQFVAILVLWLGLRFSFPGMFRSNVRIGEIGAGTSVLGGSEPMAWWKVALRIGLMILFLGSANAALRFSSATPEMMGLFGGRLLGGFNNSLIEEIVFRGLLLPAFVLATGPKPANILQAAFFSIIHFSYLEEWFGWPAVVESVKLILYFGIGYLFGRAALETRGIGVSTFLHALITGAIWAALTFSGT